MYNTPSRYRMPAEWEPHAGTWLAWPHNKDHWPQKYDPIPWVYVKFIKALIEGNEHVFLCVNDAEMEETALSFLHKGGVTRGCRIFHIPTDDSWIRDYGPIFVKDDSGKLHITDWIFQSWGEKYPPWDHNDSVSEKVSQHLKLPLIETHMVLEGGSIDVNGKGTLLTTEQCLLNPNRNPRLRREDIEENLRKYLGASHIVWLKEGVVGDDTDGHIDDIARFVNETTVACVLEKDLQDANYALLKDNFDILKASKNQDGTPLTVITLPMPTPVIFEGQRLPASYANFLIANSAVIVPTFRCPQDREALEILGKLFPTRKIIGVDCYDLVLGLGTLHCSSQQQPF